MGHDVANIPFPPRKPKKAKQSGGSGGGGSSGTVGMAILLVAVPSAIGLALLVWVVLGRAVEAGWLAASVVP